jgi:hypothetical protein
MMLSIGEIIPGVMAELLLAKARREGVLVYLTGSELRIGNCSAELEAQLRQHKTEVTALINEHFLGF